jgi:DNA-binding PadR family transcriptional regulator
MRNNPRFTNAANQWAHRFALHGDAHAEFGERREPPKTSLALAVLVLLGERPMHPYEMKTLMAERGHGNVLRLAGASIYDTVGRLERQGLIETLETSREGRRPERTVYGITDAGREEIHSWLIDLISDPVKEYPAYAAALAFILGLTRTEAIHMLQRRTMALDAAIAAGKSLLKTALGSGLPEIVFVEEEYLQAMREAELKFTHGVIRRLEDGSLKWPTKPEDWPREFWPEESKSKEKTEDKK